MPHFRSRPVEIDAVQLLWKNWSEVVDFLGEALLAENPNGASGWQNGSGVVDISIRLYVRTIQGERVPVNHGEWIIAESEPGRFYPCDAEVFARRYEEVMSS